MLTESEKKKKKMRHGRKWVSCVTEGKEKMLLHTKRWKQELLSRERKNRKRYLASQHAQIEKVMSQKGGTEMLMFRP